MTLSAKFGAHACTHKGNNMGVLEWSLMNILTVVCIVYVCLIPAVTTQSGTVFSVIVQDAQSMNNFSFDSQGFTALYQCLCSANYDACQTTPLSDDLKDVRGCPHTNSGPSGNMYTQCKISTDVTCSRKDLGNIKCNQTIPKNVVICDSIQLEWNINKKIALQSHTKNIDISRCSRYKPNCIYLITTNVNSFEQRDELLIVEVNATAPGTTPSSNPAATLSPTTSRSSDPTASSSPTPGGASSVKAEDDSDDDIPIIIGVIVGVVVVVAIIVIIVVVLWKRKKKSPSSPGINNNNNNNSNSNNNNNSNSNNNDSQLEDTDISPYATYSMSNVRPNQYSTNQKNKLNTTTTSLNSNNDNTNPNQATPDVYATVDLSKKQKKTAASPDNNNDDSNGETNSRQKKRKSHRNLDYEDVDMDNGAGYYYSSSDVLNDQAKANSPPNSSAKPKSYDVYSETGEEPSAAYAQVLKKDKSKNKSAESEERAGPSRSYDNSGYEFVTIDTPKESSL